jgi:hypothetical protein
MIGAGSRTVTFISAYRPPQTSAKEAGDTTAWMQQYTLLRLGGEAAPDPRQAFIRDLSKFIKEGQAEIGREILLMVDANERIGDTKTGIGQLIQECELMDLHHYRHPDIAPVRTYLRGSKTIDYIFGSQGIVDSMLSAGKLPFQYGIFSDHRALYVDLDAEILFNGATQDVTSATARDFNSHDPRLMLESCPSSTAPRQSLMGSAF